MESTKTSIFSHINHEIQCPLCQKKFNNKTSFIELNFHLYNCGKEKVIRSKSNINLQNLLNEESQEIINDKYKYKSETKRDINIDKDESDIIENTFNDLQLVIDYNEEENKFEEEHLKNIRKLDNSKVKYIELRDFLTRKKEQMNFLMTIECNSFSQLFKSLKEINVYYDIVFIYKKKNNETKKYCLNYAINKYVKTMIKLNRFEVIYEENILSFSFNNPKIDFEMIGVIFAILFIYPHIKIKYKFPKLLFKMLINENLCLEDIKYENKELYQKLIDLTKAEDISKLNLVYMYEENELILGGSNIKINEINVYDYVEKVVNYEMNKYKKEINNMKEILYQFVPKKFIFSFNADQLEQIINKVL